MVAEYEWSQIEPATAVFCASIVTYGPLCASISQHLSQVSAYLSSSNETVSEGPKWMEVNESVPRPPPKDYKPTSLSSLPQESFRTHQEKQLLNDRRPPPAIMAREGLRRI